MKNFLLVLLLTVTAFTYTSCSDDDPVAPKISFPSTGQPVNVTVGETLAFEFSVEAESGYKSHELKAAGGTIFEDLSTPGDGEKNFTIKGTFKAGDTAGPGGITLTVIDNKGLSTTETMALDIRK